MSQSDVVVIGGGPGGATVAALLAQRGRSVVLLEKARHPRFHIGESLLPMNLPLLERLGVDAQIAQIGMPKYGAEFVSPWHGAPVTFDFANAVDKAFPLAYQVRRSDFDEVLFRNAVAKGAHAVEGCRAIAVEYNEGEALVRTRRDDGTLESWPAKFVVDASGRDTLLANQHGQKERNKKHNSAAIFGHFEHATRLPGKAEGNISLFWFEHGWFWFIPLADGATSIGAVCWPYYMKTRKTEPAQFLLDTIALCPALTERLRGARLCSPVTATGNYSYAVKRATGPRHLLVGDAYTFIDPVFSTGVLFAMQSGFTAADTLTTCLDEPSATARALRAYERTMRHGPRVFSWFIHRVTTPTLRDLFMDPRNEQLQEAVLSVLAGDIFRGTRLGWRLTAFKAIYYLKNAASPLRSLRAWSNRRRAIRDTQVAGAWP